MALRRDHHEQLLAILTDEQKATLEALKEERLEHRRKLRQQRNG
ncbi:hypothetical protein [Microbulbifer sediminum]|nr:hypothetical protein [Microbulbifer sediminum]